MEKQQGGNKGQSTADESTGFAQQLAILQEV
jgi:hypothetical protein